MNALAQLIVDRLSDRLGGGVEKYSAASLNRAVKAAANETDANPTDAQKEAGNYRKGRFSWNGMSIAIENPAGSIRSGKSKSGHEWSIKMPIHYGYIARTESEADGDAVDVFVGPNPESEIVFVVDQQRGDGGQFDEHKVVIGYSTEQAAREAYRSCYSPGWKGLKSITPMTVGQFKAWLDEGSSGNPIAGQVSKYAKNRVASGQLGFGFKEDIGQKSFKWREELHPRAADGKFSTEENKGQKSPEAENQAKDDSNQELPNEQPVGFDPEQAVKVAADSIDKLRKPDVYRVIEWTPEEHRGAVAEYISSNRPDLADEVADVSEELGVKPASEMASPEVAQVEEQDKPEELNQSNYAAVMAQKAKEKLATGGKLMHATHLSYTEFTDPSQIKESGGQLLVMQRGKWVGIPVMNTNMMAKQLGMPNYIDTPPTAEKQAEMNRKAEDAQRQSDESDRQAAEYEEFVNKHFGGSFAKALDARDAAGFSDDNHSEWMMSVEVAKKLDEEPQKFSRTQLAESIRMALGGVAEKYRKQYDPNEEGHWVTIDGNHVFIKDSVAGDHAKSMGKVYRVKAEHIQHLMPEAHQFLKDQIDQREIAKAHARKLSRLNSGSIAKIENNYRDWSSVDGFDAIARDVALAHPELGLDPDDTDTPGKVWDLIREGKQEYPAKDSAEVAELAAKWLKSSTPANKQEYPEDALEFSRKGEVYRPMSTFAERVAYALRQRVEKYSFNEQDHPRDESGKFTEKDGDDSGRVRMRQAKAGGEVSEVDGKFYKGGHWLPVHGKYSGQEKPEKNPKQEGDSGPVFANENSRGPVMARQLSPEQVEEERARDREQRDWSGIQSGPLGQLLRLGDRPHNIRRTWGDIRKWAELFESGEITTDGLEDAEQFARNKIRQIEEEKDPSMTADDWRYYAGTVEENSERDREQYAPRSLKKLLNAHPAITNARTWVSYLLDANQDIDTLKEINDRLSGRAEMYSFQESQHPRDEIGRFVEKAASSHAAAKKSAKTVEERRKSYESLVAKREAAGNDDDISDEEQQAEDQLDVAEAEEEDNRLDAEIAESDAVSAADEAIDALNQEEPDLAKELAVAERNHKKLARLASAMRERANRLKQSADSGNGPITPEVKEAIANHKKLAAVAAKKRDKANKLKGVVADLEQQKREAETQVESYSQQIDDLSKRQNAAVEKYVNVSRDPDTTDEDVDTAYAAMKQIEKEEDDLSRIVNPLVSAVEKLDDKIDKAKEVQQEAEDDADEADGNAAEAFAEIADAKRTAAMELFDEADVDADDAESEAEDSRQELESLRAEHAKTIEQRDELKAMRARLPSMIAERIAVLLGDTGGLIAGG